MSEWITPDEVKEHHDNGYAAGIAHERKRIIKLLEACGKSHKWHVENVMCCEGECDAEPAVTERKRLIALIKGETAHEFYRNQGAQQERRRIKAAIMKRVADLEACHKNDDCSEFASLIESYIPEWLEETE